jgi:glutamine synthetase
MMDQLSPQLLEAFIVLKRDEIARYIHAHPNHTRDVTKWEIDEYLRDF